MPIKVGDQFPSVKLTRVGADGVEQIDTGEYFKNKHIIVLSVPGAFTPTCSKTHLPGFVAKADQLKAKGIHEILCLAVNDHWVMKAWSDDQGAQGRVGMLPDGSGVLTKALGIERDLIGKGLGVRGQRACLRVENGVVKEIN